MTPDPTILTYLLKTFLAVFKAGFGPVMLDAKSLLAILASIELTIAVLFWLIRGEDALVGLIQKILFVGVFIFFVTNWPMLVDTVAKGFSATGAKAGGGVNLPAITDPSAIVDYGFTVTLPLQKKIVEISSGWGALQNIGDIIMYGWAEIGILGAFFVLAIQAFVTYLEFYIVAVLALILVPFGVFRHTAFMAEKAFGVVIAHGVKLMVLSLILSAAMPVLMQLSIPAEPSVKTAWCMLLASFAVLFLAWHAPGIAGGMMAGGPALTAGSAAGTAVAAGAGVLAAGAGGAWAASRASAGADKTIGAAGALQTGAQMGALDSALAGGGTRARIVGAAAGAMRVVSHAASAPVRNLGATMAQKLREGNLKGYDISRGTSFSAPRDSSGVPARRTGASFSNAKWARNAIPPDSHPQGGISAPIRHDSEGKS